VTPLRYRGWYAVSLPLSTRLHNGMRPVILRLAQAHTPSTDIVCHPSRKANSGTISPPQRYPSVNSLKKNPRLPTGVNMSAGGPREPPHAGWLAQYRVSS